MEIEKTDLLLRPRKFEIWKTHMSDPRIGSEDFSDLIISATNHMLSCQQTKWDQVWRTKLTTPIVPTLISILSSATNHKLSCQQTKWDQVWRKPNQHLKNKTDNSYSTYINFYPVGIPKLICIVPILISIVNFNFIFSVSSYHLPPSVVGVVTFFLFSWNPLTLSTQCHDDMYQGKLALFPPSPRRRPRPCPPPLCLPSTEADGGINKGWLLFLLHVLSLLWLCFI